MMTMQMMVQCVVWVVVMVCVQCRHRRRRRCPRRACRVVVGRGRLRVRSRRQPSADRELCQTVHAAWIDAADAMNEHDSTAIC